MKTHRIGTLTLGIMLVTFGLLFLMRIFFPQISYEIIFKLWPVIFIFLGSEILYATTRQKEGKLIYDKTAFALIIILSFFAMGMAVAELCINYSYAHYDLVWR